MVAATQAANHTTPQSIQATKQPLGVDNRDLKIEVWPSYRKRQTAVCA